MSFVPAHTKRPAPSLFVALRAKILPYPPPGTGLGIVFHTRTRLKTEQ